MKDTGMIQRSAISNQRSAFRPQTTDHWPLILRLLLALLIVCPGMTRPACGLVLPDEYGMTLPQPFKAEYIVFQCPKVYVGPYEFEVCADCAGGPAPTPVNTPIPVDTNTPAPTPTGPTPTVTATPPATNTPTITLTPAITNTPPITATDIPTMPPEPTITLTASPTPTSHTTLTPIVTPNVGFPILRYVRRATADEEGLAIIETPEISNEKNFVGFTAYTSNGGARWTGISQENIALDLSNPELPRVEIQTTPGAIVDLCLKVQNKQGDLDGSGEVQTDDLLLLMKNWRK